MPAATDREHLQSRLERLLGPRRAPSDPDLLLPYASDESGLGSYPPDAVALVESAEEVREVLRLAQLDRIPVVPRGLGTGMTGGALATEGGIVISTERMARIRDLDPGNLLAVVEPGMVTGQFQEAVEERGLFYPPDPASLESCSLGGNVAENAGGPRAFKYGVTREYVLGLELTLMGGQTLQLGRRTVKGVTGLDVVALVVGSEGTFGVITEITLKLLPRPQSVATFLAQFADAVSACTAVTELIRRGHHPRTLEFIDGTMLEHLRATGKWPIPPEAGALLLIELDGDARGMEAQLLDAAAACEATGAVDILVATDEARRRQMWEMRRNANPVITEAYAFKVSEDVVVPRAQIPRMVQRLDRLSAQHDTTIAVFGHAGDGNLHVNVLFDDERVKQRLEPVLTGIFRAALDLGGTLSGEHGIGIAKRRFMPLEQPPELLDLERRLKRAFDPHNLMNPGKLLP
jgi:glycolate oxidase